MAVAVLRSHLPELVQAADAVGLEHVTPVDDGVVAVDLRPGATYADVARFESAAAGLLGAPVTAVSTDVAESVEPRADCPGGKWASEPPAGR